MKRYIWLVSYLVKDENGDVAGYKTAFEAPALDWQTRRARS